MTPTENLERILKKEQEDEIILFLRQLDKKQREELEPEVKRLFKYYSEFSNFGGGSSYSHRWSPSQRQMFGILTFVCYSQKDFEQAFLGSTLTKETLSQILPWYCPKWFSKYVDTHTGSVFLPHNFDYDHYMHLVEQGYLKSNKTLIARLLPNLIVRRGNQQNNHRWLYTPEDLHIRDITLKEHIWYIFEEETFIHSVEKYAFFDDRNEGSKWILTLKDLIKNGHLERKRVLKESIAAASRGFNQPLSNWFVDLFTDLLPTPAELVELQEQLLSTFNSNFSKVSNTGVKYLKDIATVAGFDIDGFLGHISLLMSSESKTAVSSALMTLDKLAKKYADSREQICLLAAEALIQQDNNLQVRAAKLLQKYGETASDELKEAISTYRDGLFLEAKFLLTEFLDEPVSEPLAGEDIIEDTTDELRPISFPETFDEFVFLASQAFDQNEPYHFDLLPAAILRFQNKMTAANIQKLAPAFQRAYKLIVSDFTATRGYLDNMLAKFFVDWGKLLVKFHPEAAAPVKQMHDNYALSNNKQFETRLKNGIKAWAVYSGSTGYRNHKYLLLNAIFLLERRMELPLLSTPTHAPCWVSPMALVERLVQYQDAKVIPGDTDFMLAVARCLKGHDEAAVLLANEKLRLDYRRILSYLFGGRQDPNALLQLKPVWLVMALTREPAEMDKAWLNLTDLTDYYLKADFLWESKHVPFTYKRWDYNLRKNVEAQDTHKVISIQFGEKYKQPSSLKTFLGKFMPSLKPNEPSLYDFILLKYDHISAEHNDIKRLLHINPHKPELMIAHIIDKALRSTEFSGENDKKMIVNTMEALMELNTGYGPMGHLLIASCMICNDKTIRTYAAELWLKAVGSNKIDSRMIGMIVGKHQRVELAPVKRFTDLVLSNMMGISSKHNKALLLLLNACITNMTDKPINNIKKLLEVYAEVLALNKETINNDAVIKKLSAWQATEALAKPVQKIKVVAGMK